MKAQWKALISYNIFDTDGMFLTTVFDEQQAIDKVRELNDEPKVLFDSATVKVFKFKDCKQLSDWYADDIPHRNYISASTYDFKLPLIAFTNSNGVTIILGNITRDLLNDFDDLINTGGLV